MYNNSFSYIEDFERAQELADRMLKKISDSFDGMVKKINCLLPGIEEVCSHSCHWCIDQCGFAADNREIISDLRHRYREVPNKVQNQ